MFVAGGDDKLHVYDAANGKEIWSAAFGPRAAAFLRYELDGRQYLLMTALRPWGRPEQRQIRPDLPHGLVAFALPWGRSSGTRATGWLDALLLTGGRRWGGWRGSFPAYVESILGLLARRLMGRR